MASKDTAYNRMYSKVSNLQDCDLVAVWNALNDPKVWVGEYQDGISVNEWAQAVDSELSRRGLKK